MWSAKFLTPLGVALAWLALGLVLTGILAAICFVLAVFFFVGALVALRQSSEAEKQRAQDALEAWRKQIREWVLEDNPLTKAQLNDPRRDLAATQTRALLRKKLDPDQKREVLEYLAYSNLIDRDSPAVILNKADFSNANLRDLHLRDIWLGFACFRKADFTGATFSDSDVSETNHHIALRMGIPEEDLENPVGKCMLWHSDFSGAILKDARLGGCNLAGADFRGADLDGADLRGAFLKDAKNLTQRQINKAYGSYGREWVEDTRSLPKGINYPEAWRKPIREQRADRERSRGVLHRLARFLRFRD
jgi:uncharacterized protein YjbI with pentapeptide repeats